MHTPEKEQAPRLTPLETVLRESIYGNVKLPQSGLAIVVYTLRALFNAENPRELIKQYLTTPLPRKSAERMMLHGNQAHAHYLPEGKRPELSIELMEELWESEQGAAADFLRMVNHLPLSDRGEESFNWEKERAFALTLLEKRLLPISDIRKIIGYYAEALRDPIISEKILALKQSYGSWQGKGTLEEEKVNDAHQEVANLVQEYAERKVRADESVDSSVAKTILEGFASQI